MLNDAYITRYFYSAAGSDASQPLCLSVVISPHSFMYAVSIHDFRSVTELCHVQLTAAVNATGSDLTDSVTFLMNNYQLPRRKFAKINIALLDTDFALVPEAYAGQGQLKPLLAFATGDTHIKNVWQHTVSGIAFCYTPDMQLAMYLERTFPNASIKHAGAITMQMLFSLHALKNCDVFLNIHDDFIELAAKEKNGLLFYNVFNYGNNEDILYYLLFMMEQFHLDPLVIRLGIAGQRPVSDDLFKSIKKYIKQAEVCFRDASVTLNGDMAQLPGHYYFTLLNQHLCEL